MGFTIDVPTLIEIMPHAVQRAALFVDPFNEVFGKYAINTPVRVAMFLAQVAHECGELSELEENLNYSAEALMRVFPRHFDADSAAQYARQPEKIANRVYANRMGNGNEDSGDGWGFHGRGCIQITGRDNYTACSASVYGDLQVLLDVPEKLLQPEGAVLSAGWFWARGSLNELADGGDIQGCTRIINGGLNGLDQRQAYWEQAKSVLGV